MIFLFILSIRNLISRFFIIINIKYKKLQLKIIYKRIIKIYLKRIDIYILIINFENLKEKYSDYSHSILYFIIKSILNNS